MYSLCTPIGVTTALSPEAHLMPQHATEPEAQQDPAHSSDHRMQPRPRPCPLMLFNQIARSDVAALH